MAGFQRIQPIGIGTIRGPARILVAPVGTPFPANLSAMINLAPTSVSYASAVETISITGAPTGGTFTLEFQAYTTPAIPYNATAAQVQTALNTIAGVVSAGGITCTGGPLPTTPVVATFGANGSQPLFTVGANSLTGGTTPAPNVVMTTAGNGQYDVALASGWTDLGSTRSGVQTSRNNTETQLDVDQIYGAITAVPDEWEMTIATQFAETTWQNLQTAWEGGVVTLDATQTPNEQHLPMGAPTHYTERLLAVLHQKTIGPHAGAVRALVFRRVLRSPQNSTLDYQKTGQMQTIPHSFRAFADWTITDETKRFADFIEQVI